MNAARTLGAAVWLSLGLTQPAAAAAGQPLGTLVHWAGHQKLLAGFHEVPQDDPGPTVLYACRYGGYETIVRVFLDHSRIVKEQVEVALPGDRADEIAMGIINRFFHEFMNGRGRERDLWNVMNSLRSSLARSGLKQEDGDFLGYHLALRLDTAPDSAMMSQERGTWGTLFWTGEASLPRRHRGS